MPFEPDLPLHASRFTDRKGRVWTLDVSALSAEGEACFRSGDVEVYGPNLTRHRGPGDTSIDDDLKWWADVLDNPEPKRRATVAKQAAAEAAHLASVLQRIERAPSLDELRDIADDSAGKITEKQARTVRAAIAARVEALKEEAAKPVPAPAPAEPEAKPAADTKPPPRKQTEDSEGSEDTRTPLEIALGAPRK